MAKQGISGKKKILIVDDDPTLIMMIERRLQSSGFDVVSAKSGQEGVEKALRERPDLILLDVTMPGMDGYETLKALKQHPETSELRVVMFTAKSGSEDRAKSLHLGAEDYLNKGLPFEDVLQKLRILLYES